MFKKLINNPLDVIGNAVEINVHKTNRKSLEDEKKEYEKKCNKYDEHMSFKRHIGSVALSMNAETINRLRTIFERNNIVYDVTYSEFEIRCGDAEFRVYKKLFDAMMTSTLAMNETIEQIDKVIGVDKQVYLDKISHIDSKLSDVNQKLRNVRDKQFGKKNAPPPPPPMNQPEPAPILQQVEVRKEENLINFDPFE